MRNTARKGQLCCRKKTGKVEQDWLPFQTHIKCMYQRFTLGGSDAGWAKHDLTYRVKGYPSDPNIQRQTVRKFCGHKKIIFQFCCCFLVAVASLEPILFTNSESVTRLFWDCR